MVPDGWAEVWMKELVEIDRDSVSPAVLEGHEVVHLYSLPAFDEGDGPAIVKGASIGSTKVRVPRETVLLSKLNPHIPRIWHVEHSAQELAVASSEFWPLIPRKDGPELDLEFLSYSLSNSTFLKHPLIQPASSTNSHKRIRRSAFMRFPQLLPPLLEQRRIAAILSSVDDAIATSRKVIEQTKRVKQGLLQTFLTRGIEHTRFKKTEIGEIPEEWKLVRLHSISRKITDGTHQSVDTVEEGPIPFLYVSCIRNGTIDTGSGAFVSEETYASISPGREPFPGLVLYTAVGSYGHAAVVRDDARLAFQRHVAYIAPKPEQVVPDYLAEFLNSVQGRQEADRVAVGNAQKTVTLRDLRNFRVPLPPRREQKAIVDLLSGVDAQVNCGEALADQLALLKRGLMQDLLSGRVRVQPD